MDIKCKPLQITNIKQAYNEFCPLSGEKIKDDALINCQNIIIGFANQDIRAQFLANPSHMPVVIELIEAAKQDVNYNSRLRWFGRKIGPGLRTHQKQRLDSLLPKYQLTLDDIKNKDHKCLQSNELWLEIGFGGGEHLYETARRNPKKTFIGCEPYLNGVASLLLKLEEEPLQNVYIFSDDARELLDFLPNNSLSGVFILFADPWPKRKHNRRRFINEENLTVLAEKLQRNALLRFATDHTDYAPWALAHLLQNDNFIWQSERYADWLNEPQDHVKTRYQQKAEADDVACRFFNFIRA